MPNQSDTEFKILRQRDVKAMTGLPLSSMYAMIANGKFPKPIPLAPRSVGWLYSEVEAWVRARIAARDSKVTE
jgi:prophage regulatory protein